MNENELRIIRDNIDKVDDFMVFADPMKIMHVIYFQPMDDTLSVIGARALIKNIQSVGQSFVLDIQGSALHFLERCYIKDFQLVIDAVKKCLTDSYYMLKKKLRDFLLLCHLRPIDRKEVRASFESIMTRKYYPKINRLEFTQYMVAHLEDNFVNRENASKIIEKISFLSFSTPKKHKSIIAAQLLKKLNLMCRYTNIDVQEKFFQRFEEEFAHPHVPIRVRVASNYLENTSKYEELLTLNLLGYNLTGLSEYTQQQIRLKVRDRNYYEKEITLLFNGSQQPIYTMAKVCYLDCEHLVGKSMKFRDFRDGFITSLSYKLISLPRMIGKRDVLSTIMQQKMLGVIAAGKKTKSNKL